jgi:hypothetical protein
MIMVGELRLSSLEAGAMAPCGYSKIYRDVEASLSALVMRVPL